MTTGRFFSVTFIKRTNGELRRLTTRGGVTKDVQGEGKNYSDEEKRLMTCYDIHKRAWRSVPIDDIIAVNNKNLKEVG